MAIETIKFARYPHRRLMVAQLILLFLVVGCAHLTGSWISPGLTLAGIRPVQMSAEQQIFIVSINVNNRNNRTLPIKGVSYNLEVEGHRIANGGGSLDQQIPAFSEGVVDIEVNTRLLDLVGEWPSLASGGGRWDYELSGVFKLAGGFVPVPFRYSGQVEAAQIMDLLAP